MTIALTLVVRQQTSADADRGHPEWRMIGHDIRNTRSQPSEHHISPRNVDLLSPRWTLTTAGDVSATPAVIRESNRRGNGRGHSDLVLYYPDWGGMLWKVEAETGDVLWSRQISEYNGIAGSISRTSPALSHGLVLVGDLNGNMMGVDAATGDLALDHRTRPESEHDRHDISGRARRQPVHRDILVGRGYTPHGVSRKHDRARHTDRRDRLAVIRPAG